MCSVSRSGIHTAAARSRPGRRRIRRCRPGASLACTEGTARRAALLLALLSAAVNGAAGGQQTASSCPVTLAYAADLGLGGANSQDPTFDGRLNISNTASQVAVQNFEIAWNFTDGESIIGTGNVTAPLKAVDLAAPQVIMQAGGNGSAAGNIAAGGSLQCSFLGTKSGAAPDPSNPYRVAAPTDMAFNNLPCELMPAASAAAGFGAESSTVVAVPARPNPNGSDPTSSLLIEYAPIEYVTLPIGIFATAFTQFLVRVANVADATAVPLANVTYQYWFNGPDGVAAFATSSPSDLFELQCSDATTGCETITWNFTRGLNDTQGALFVLNVGFLPAAGKLQQIQEDSISNFTSGTQAHQPQNSVLNVMQVLASIQIKRLALVQMNQTLDYSYENTPVSNQAANGSQTVPRKPVPNWGMPAYINNSLVWGSPPKTPPVPPQPPPPAQPLPPGIQCQNDVASNSTIQHCMLVAEYCCNGAQLSATIPAVFPPVDSSSDDSPPPPPPAPPTLPPPDPSSPAGNATHASSSQEAAAGSGPASSGSGGSGVSAVAIAAPVAGGVAALLVAAAALFVLWRRRQRRKGAAGRQMADAEACREDSGKSSGGGSESAGVKTPLVAANGRHSRPGDLSMMGLSQHQTSVLSWSDWRQRRNSQLHEHANRVVLSRQSSGVTDGSGRWPDCEQGLETYDPAAEAARRWASQPALARLSSMSAPDCLAPGSPNFVLMAPSLVGQTVQADAGKLPTGQSSSGSVDGIAKRLVRRHSWGGPLQMPDSELPLALQAPAATSMGSPFMPPLPYSSLGWGHGLTAEGVDLHVNYATEVEPFLGRRLGSGGFGDVFEATWRGRRVAVKKLPQLAEMRNRDAPTPEAQYAALIAEIQLSCRFKSSRLVSVLGACLGEPSQACLIMELVEGGSLAARIHDRKKRRLTYLQILQIAHDVAAGLAYLHPAVVHRDLKPHNVLLEAGPAGRAKVADFGISRVKDPTKSYLSATNNNGTPMYMAPEQFNGTHLDEKVDVYSLGCILNECWTRQQPWRDSSHFFQIIKSVAIDAERPAVASDTPPQLRRLIRKCWEQDPRHRPSCMELVRFTDILMQHEVARLRAAAGRAGSGALNNNGSRLQPVGSVRAGSSGSDATQPSPVAAGGGPGVAGGSSSGATQPSPAAASSGSGAAGDHGTIPAAQRPAPSRAGSGGSDTATMSGPAAAGGGGTAGMPPAAAATQPGSEGSVAAVLPSPVATAGRAEAAAEARPIEPGKAAPSLHSADRGTAADINTPAAPTAAEGATAVGNVCSVGHAAAGTGVGRDLGGCRPADAAAAGSDWRRQPPAGEGDDRHPSGAGSPDTPPLQGASTPELRSLCRRHRLPSDASSATTSGCDSGGLGNSRSGAVAAAAGATQGGFSRTLAPAT